MATVKQDASAPSAIPVRSVIARRPVVLKDFGPTRAKQSMKAECDINNIMAKYQRTGAVTHFSKHSPQYGYAPATEFREALEIVREGEALFKALPSKIRNKFENDPAQFLEFVQNPENLDEMRELGLANPRAPEAPAAPVEPPKEA